MWFVVGSNTHIPGLHGHSQRRRTRTCHRITKMTMRILSFLLLSFLLLAPSAVAQESASAKWVDVSGEGWVYYNLAENRVASEQEAGFGAWDVAFQGTTVKFNGPSQLLSMAFDQVHIVPNEGYAQEEDGTSQLPTDAESRWFDYDFNTHVISARPAVFKGRDGRWGKLNITDYYKVVFGAAPIPRQLSFRWMIAAQDSPMFH